MSAPRRPWRGLWPALWLPLVGSLPIALLFGTLDWLGWLGYLIAYQIALVFAYPISLSVWITRSFLIRSPRASASGRRRLWAREVIPITAAAVVGALAGMAILEGMQRGTIRGLTVVQILMFTLLFCALALAVTYAVAFHRDSVERARTEAELRHARQLQLTMIGRSFPDHLPLDVHAVVAPSRQVGGDLYDIVPAADGSIYLAIADIAGKRMPAALLSSSLLASLRMLAGTQSAVEEIVAGINRFLCRSRITDERLFAALFLARYEPESRRLDYTNAGNRHPRLLRRSGTTQALEEGGTIVGMLETAEYARGSVVLEPGDCLLLYTDGIVEAANGRGEMFGEDALVALVRALPPDRTARQITDAVLEKVRAFQGGRESADDLTLMAVRVPG